MKHKTAALLPLVCLAGTLLFGCGPAAEYTVTFDSSSVGEALPDQVVQQGQTLTPVEDPTRDGYTFLGWFQDATLNTPWQMDSDKVEGDMTLYAGWGKDTGDTIADLQEDMGAEQKARMTYDNILRFADDPDVRDPIKFLREREIVHFQRFGEGLRILTDKLDSKNFYAFNPSFDKP